MKFVSIVLLCVILIGCGHPQTIDGKFYPTYGLFNFNSTQSSKVCYDVSVGNVVWSIVLIESIVIPVYLIGFSLFNPTKSTNNGSCSIDT